MDFSIGKFQKVESGDQRLPVIQIFSESIPNEFELGLHLLELSEFPSDPLKSFSNKYDTNEKPCGLSNEDKSSKPLGIWDNTSMKNLDLIIDEEKYQSYLHDTSPIIQ